MKEPGPICERRQIDLGAGRCPIFAATDLGRRLSPHHARFAALAEQEAALPSPAFAYRRM